MSPKRVRRRRNNSTSHPTTNFTTQVKATARISGKKRQASFIGGDPTAPTKKEWEEMKSYISFVVEDDEGKGHRFAADNYALVLPEGASPRDSLRMRDFWVGKIKDIRSRHGNPKEVWVKIQWLWSIGDLLKLNHRIDPTPFGQMERILSNHFDFVHSSSFAGLVKVQPYVESDPEPPAINDETFYYRSTYEIYSRIIRSLPTATCFCGEAYNPNETAVMHFCPRKGCCRAFHADCLRQSRYVEVPRKDMQALRSQRGLQFERNIPSDGEDGEDEQGEDSGSCGRLPTPSSPISKASPARDRHSELPAPLLALARSPMVKGLGTDLPYEWSCVTGNFAVVARARRLVRDALESRSKKSGLPTKWRTLLEIPGEEGTSDDLIDESKVRAWIVEDVNLFLCPVCKGAI